MVILNDFGRIAQNEWIKTAQIRAYVKLDVFKIMPDHLHGILVIVHDDDQCQGMEQSVGATGPVAPTSQDEYTSATLKPASLGSIIGQYKSAVTKKIRKIGKTDFKWQRGFYDHVIRNEKELFPLRRYILNNPSKY